MSSIYRISVRALDPIASETPSCIQAKLVLSTNVTRSTLIDICKEEKVMRDPELVFTKTDLRNLRSKVHTSTNSSIRSH